MNARYDLSNRPATGVTMTRGKPVQGGIRAKLPANTTWSQLAAMSPEETKTKNAWPAGFSRAMTRKQVVLPGAARHDWWSEDCTEASAEDEKRKAAKHIIPPAQRAATGSYTLLLFAEILVDPREQPSECAARCPTGDARVVVEGSPAPSGQRRHPIADPPIRHAAVHQIERARMSSPLAAVRLSIASDGSSSTVDPSVDTSSRLRRHLSWIASA